MHRVRSGAAVRSSLCAAVVFALVMGLAWPIPSAARGVTPKATSGQATADERVTERVSIQAPETLSYVLQNRPDQPSAQREIKPDTLFSDGFESGMGAWTLYTYSSAYWGTSAYRASAGSNSAYCAGSSIAAPGPYPNDMYEWMVAGPFDLSDANAATWVFDAYVDTEESWDYVWALVSADGSNFDGVGWSGDFGGWFEYTMDLAEIYGDGTGPGFLGDSSVWVAFLFESDSSVAYEGAYVDDVLVTKETGAVPGDDDTFPGVQLPASPVADSLDSAADVADIYHKTISGGGNITASLSGAGGTDFDLYLYPPGSDSLSDPTVAAATGSTYPKSINYTIPAGSGGTYYLVPRATTGSGSYTLSYTITEPPVSVADKAAVVCGISDYPGTSMDLNYCDDDAEEFAQELVDECGYAAEDVLTLIDSEVTYAGIQDAIESWLDQREDANTQVTFFFSGHGTNVADASPYDEADGRDEAICAYDDIILDDELGDWLSGLESDEILFISDSCFSGGLLKSPSATAKGLPAADGFRGALDGSLDDVDAPGREVMSACDDDETSAELPELQNGIFTYYLLEALWSDASDTDGNGYVCAEEAFDDLLPNVTPEGFTPQFYDGFTGDIDLAPAEGGGEGGGTPEIVTDPEETADFGTVEVGESADRTITISNQGDGTLEIGDIATLGWDTDDYEVVTDNASGQSIPPGESREIVVRYAPQTAREGDVAFQEIPGEGWVIWYWYSGYSLTSMTYVRMVENVGGCGTYDYAAAFDARSTDGQAEATAGDRRLLWVDCPVSEGGSTDIVIEAAGFTDSLTINGVYATGDPEFNALRVVDGRFEIPTNDPDENPRLVKFVGEAVPEGTNPADPDDPDDPDKPVDLPDGLFRVAGTDRYATAVEASKKAFPNGADTVVIATGANWPDALGGSALAGAVNGPLLLSQPAALPEIVIAEIGRLGARKAYVLGGTGAVSSTVELQLKTALGAANVTRLAGADRYQTARAVADETVKLAGAGFSGTVFVATGGNFPDALAGSPVAAANEWPIVLVNPANGTAQLPASTTEAVILGGTGAVSSLTELSLRATLGSENVARAGGANRYETAALVAAAGVASGLSWDGVGVATGENFPDALSGGAMLGAFGSVMLLTPSATLHPAAATQLSGNAATISTAHIVGGPGAVSTTVEASVRTATGL